MSDSITIFIDTQSQPAGELSFSPSSTPKKLPSAEFKADTQDSSKVMLEAGRAFLLPVSCCAEVGCYTRNWP